MADEFINHKWINENSLERRDYQIDIAKECLKGNTLVVIPTGLGKTTIAALVSAFRLENDMYGKILFVAPTKPLVDQHRKFFLKALKIGPSEISAVTGKIPPEERKKIYEKSDVVIATPQTIENDIKNGRLKLDDFILLIVDEAHRSVGNYAYTYIAKKYMEESKSPLIIGLTASPGGNYSKINEIKKQLFIRYIQSRTENDVDVKKYIYGKKLEWVKVGLTEPMKKIKSYLEEIKSDRISKLMKWGVIRRSNVTKTELINLQKRLSKSKAYMFVSVIAETIKIDYCLTLLETQTLHGLKKYFDSLLNQDSKSVKRLLSEENFKKAMRLTLELLKDGREHPKIEKLVDIVKRELGKKMIIFTQFRSTGEVILERIKKIDGCRPSLFIGQSKGMKQKEQIDVIRDFKIDVYNVLVATSVGEEGLDIPEVDVVIFYEPIPSAVRTIQRRGRTGRHREGKVITLITEGTRDESYYWVSKRKEKKMKKIIENFSKEQGLKKFIGD